jgi:hypothetical protein
MSWFLEMCDSNMHGDRIKIVCSVFKIHSTYIFWKKKYIKCNIWRVAVRPSYV